jgi:hypothetical protein
LDLPSPIQVTSPVSLADCWSFVLGSLRLVKSVVCLPVPDPTFQPPPKKPICPHPSQPESGSRPSRPDPSHHQTCSLFFLGPTHASTASFKSISSAQLEKNKKPQTLSSHQHPPSALVSSVATSTHATHARTAHSQDTFISRFQLSSRPPPCTATRAINQSPKRRPFPGFPQKKSINHSASHLKPSTQSRFPAFLSVCPIKKGSIARPRTRGPLEQNNRKRRRKVSHSHAFVTTASRSRIAHAVPGRPRPRPPFFASVRASAPSALPRIQASLLFSLVDRSPYDTTILQRQTHRFLLIELAFAHSLHHTPELENHPGSPDSLPFPLHSYRPPWQTRPFAIRPNIAPSSGRPHRSSNKNPSPPVWVVVIAPRG